MLKKQEVATNVTNVNVQEGASVESKAQFIAKVRTGKTTSKKIILIYAVLDNGFLSKKANHSSHLSGMDKHLFDNDTFPNLEILLNYKPESTKQLHNNEKKGLYLDILFFNRNIFCYERYGN